MVILIPLSLQQSYPPKWLALHKPNLATIFSSQWLTYNNHQEILKGLPSKYFATYHLYFSNNWNLGQSHHRLYFLSSVPTTTVYNQHNSQRTFWNSIWSVPPVFKTLPTHWLPILLGAKVKFLRRFTKLLDLPVYLVFSSYSIPTTPAMLDSLLLWVLALGLTVGLWILQTVSKALSLTSCTHIPAQLTCSGLHFLSHALPFPQQIFVPHCSPSSWTTGCT